MARRKLHQVPQIAVKVFKDGNGAVVHGFRLTHKADVLRTHRSVIALKVICCQKEKDTTAGLIADKGFLLGF